MIDFFKEYWKHDFVKIITFLSFFENSQFRDRFEAKGRFKDYCAAIPTYVITEPDHALLGAAAYLEQNFKG